MKKVFSLCLLFLICQISFSQINVELIKKNVIENPQDNFYSLLDIFKSKPNELTQAQQNQLYYGSRFVKNNYTIGNYNSDFDTFWKQTKKKLSSSEAEKIINEAEIKYLINPLNKELLDDMINIYLALDQMQKVNLCYQQKKIILQTIENSGDGISEETAICVISPGEVIEYLEKLIKSGPKGRLDQQMKQQSDGSILTVYKIGNRQINVKLIGGYFF
jgi:hypothetical protein